MTGDRTPTGDLRDRLREALIATALRQAREKGIKLSTFTTVTIHANAESLADAVLPVVEAETAALRASLDRAHAMAAEYSKRGIENGERAEEAERQRDEAHEAWTAVREESAALIQEYSEPAADRENRCGSCRQHETVDRKDAAARAMAKTARRYKRERDEALAAVQRVRDLHVRDDSSPHGPWCGVCLAPWPCRTRLATEPDQSDETPPAEHTGGNAEDCPVCRPRIDQPRGVLYPWHCTGPNPKDPA